MQLEHKKSPFPIRAITVGIALTVPWIHELCTDCLPVHLLGLEKLV